MVAGRTSVRCDNGTSPPAADGRGSSPRCAASIDVARRSRMGIRIGPSYVMPTSSPVRIASTASRISAAVKPRWAASSARGVTWRSETSGDASTRTSGRRSPRGCRYDLRRNPTQLLEIVSVHSGRHVRDRTAEQLVEAHLDRLREGGSTARSLARDGLLEMSNQLVFVEARSPAVRRSQADEHVGLLEAHDVGRDGRAADPGDDLGDLGRRVQRRAFEYSRRSDGRIEIDVRRAGRLHDEVALVELGNELAADPKEQQHAGGQQQGRASDHEPRMRGRAGQNRAVQLVDRRTTQGSRFGMSRGRRRTVAAAGTNVSESEERGRQGEDDGQRHRPEHLAVDAGQGQDRHVDEEDHQHGEEHRRRHGLGDRPRPAPGT